MTEKGLESRAPMISISSSDPDEEESLNKDTGRLTINAANQWMRCTAIGLAAIMGKLEQQKMQNSADTLGHFLAALSHYSRNQTFGHALPFNGMFG